MPLGDSITQADSQHPGYRYALWKLLKQGGYDIDFVGSMKRNFRGENPVQSFDTDHEGHWGWSADQVLNGFPGTGKLDDFLKQNTPDIVLLHLGSNDIFRGEPIQEIEADLTKIINTLVSFNKDVIILIAQILPVADVRTNQRIRTFNDAISRLPRKVSISEKQLVVVNQFEGFNPGTDTYDGAHPNSAGEDKMARKWYEALQSVISK
jgi:lysophospholipase L1-like esterase